MRYRSRGLAVAVALATGVALTLSGCESAVSRQSSSGSTPVQGGTLDIASSADAIPASVLSGKAGNTPWASNVYQTLTTYDSKHQPQPLLAKSWTLASDSTSIDVVLRDDVTFSTGRKMTADDVKFSFEKAADATSGSQVGYVAKSFKSIDVKSPTELDITFTKPLANIFDFFEYTYVLDRTTFSGLADGSDVVGTGPYLFSSWTPGSKIVLKRNPKYWGTKPYLDEIDIAVITDGTALVNALRSNTAEMAIGMGPIDAVSFKGNPAWRIDETSPSVYPLGVDTRAKPFDDQRVRQAVQYAIDRDRIDKQVFAGTGSTTNLFWTPDAPGYSTQQASHYAYDVAKAKQLIAAAGATGASFPITVINLPQNTSAAQIVRNNLEAVGLKPRIEVVDVPTFAERQVKGDLGAMFMPVHGLNGLAPASIVNVLPTLRPGNPSHFATDEYQRLTNAVATSSSSDQAAAVQAYSEYLLDQAPVVSLNEAPGLIPTAAGVHGERVSVRGYLDLSRAYLAK